MSIDEVNTIVYEICTVVGTLAFIVLVIYIVITLRALNRLILHIDTRLDPLSSETIKILQNTQQMTAFVQKQMDSFDPLLKSIASVGQTFQRTTQAFNEETERVNLSRKDKVAEICELVAISILVWQQIKKRR